MARVMKADASSADAYAVLDFAGQAEIWVSLEIAFGADYLDYVTASGGAPFVWAFQTAIDLNGVFVGAGPTAWYDVVGAGSGGTPTADVWQSGEFHYKSDGTNEWYIDGVLVYTDPGGPAATANRLKVGLGFYDADARAVVYLRSVTAGTTRGGTDLLADDGFASGTFFAWSSTTGDTSIVDDPLGAPSLPGVFDVAFDAATLEADPVWTSL